MTARHPLHDTLLAIVGERGLLAGDALAGRAGGPARLLVRPADTAEVSRVLAACNAERVPVVTHGGLTGLTNATQAGADDVVLSTERMKSVVEVSASQRVAVVEAGVPLAVVQQAADAASLFFPLDLGARGTATVGGCIATNAGGNRVLRWGMMRDSVLGLEAVLADGTVVSSMNRLIKNNAGYDLKQLFIGSEGTLGVVTRAVLRLRERPASRQMALVAVPGFGQALRLLKHMDARLGGRLSAFEILWSSFYALVTTPPATSRPPLPQGSPFYVLLEAMGADADRDREQFESVLSDAMQEGLVTDAMIAGSETQCAQLWHMRDDVHHFHRLGQIAAYDVALPLDCIESYVEEVTRQVRAAFPSVAVWIYGHLGDNNLHVVVTGGPPATHEALDHIMYAPLAALDASISGEHGIGQDKKAWLHVSRQNAELRLMRTLKATLDPNGTLNPRVLLSSEPHP